MSKQRRDPSVPEIKKSMSRPEKDFMMAHLLRLPDVFLTAKDNLEPAHFGDHDRPYAILWKAALTVADKYNGTIPDPGGKIRLELELNSLVESTPGILSSDEQEDLIGDGVSKGLVDWIYEDLKADELLPVDGVALLQEFLTERTVVKPLKEYVVGLGNDKPSNLPEMLEALDNRRGVIGSLSGGNEVVPFTTSVYQAKSPDLVPTNISFLDECMGGGQAAGEVSVILGPTGVGKTMLGMQIAYEGALYEKKVAAELGVAPRYWYYFTYEQAAEAQLMPRMISHAAQIHMTETILKKSPFSTKGDLKPYEQRKYAAELDKGNDVPGEQERYENAAKLMTPSNFVIFDMAGGDVNDPKAGHGYVDEIARYLMKQERKGRRIAGYVLDSADLIVGNYMDAKNMDPGNEHKLLERFPTRCRDQLSIRFKCAGWILHQLAGAVNNFSPTVKQHHSSAAGCKLFAKAAWFAFQLGTKDPATSTCRIHCTKQRRAGSDDKERIVFIDGAFSTMRGVDGQFTLDPRQRRIVPVAIARQLADGDAIAAAEAAAVATVSTKPKPDPVNPVAPWAGNRRLEMSPPA